MNEIDRQLEQFTEQQDWLNEEAQFAVAMKPGPARERRLVELRNRSGQFDRELMAFIARYQDQKS
ncbi:MAG TPA: hypothetical protein VG167_00980 [Verrucomicrobiae bacterium]|nr:hypothetical protein [Verrucomicrobiae bacterium]